MSERTPLANTIHAFSLLFAMLAEDLERRGAMNRKDFATRLRALIDEAETTAPADLQGQNRLDLQIARHVANLMDRPNRTGWKPVVIDGGQPPEED